MFSFFLQRNGNGREGGLRQVLKGVTFGLNGRLSSPDLKQAKRIWRVNWLLAVPSFIPHSHQGATGLFRKSVKTKQKRFYVSSIPLH